MVIDPQLELYTKKFRQAWEARSKRATPVLHEQLRLLQYLRPGHRQPGLANGGFRLPRRCNS
jgi:hypothetical protein